MLKMENNQYVRELVDRYNEQEVNTYNEHQKSLSELDNIFACIVGNGVAAERFITLLTPEVERRETITEKIFEFVDNPELTIERLNQFNNGYTTEQLEKFYNYHFKNLSGDSIVVMNETFIDPRISWGTDDMLEEIDEFEQFIADSASPLLGLPSDIKLLPGDNVGISAPTGSGKTTSLVGIAIKHLNAGKKVMFIALEETELETRARIVRQLNDRKLHRNLGFISAEGFKESNFREDFTKLLLGTNSDVILIDYINDSFVTFDVTGKNLQSFEKIKKTVAAIADINHKTLKTIMVIGVQGTATLLEANKKKILNVGKAYFEGGQSTIKPLQYAILIQDADVKEDGQTYEKMAYIVKQRNALVKSSEKTMSVPTYGMTYHLDQYQYSLVGDLKDIVKALDTKSDKTNKGSTTTAAKPKPQSAVKPKEDFGF